MFSKIEVTPEIKKEYQESKDIIYFPSKFSFLQAHNGFRPGCVHIFMAPSSGGKSTLIRSIINDTAENLRDGEKIAVWLSEESVKEFDIEFSTIFKGKGHVCSISELDMENSLNPDKLLENFIFQIKTYEPSIIFLDNITTSSFYQDRSAQDQARVSTAIKRLAFDMNIPIVLVAHTDSKTGENVPRLIDMNDIRGSRKIVNEAHFFYIMQRFILDEKIFPTLRVVKHRGFVVHHRLFGLNFDVDTISYDGDHKMHFNNLKAIFNERDRLGK